MEEVLGSLRIDAEDLSVQGVAGLSDEFTFVRSGSDYEDILYFFVYQSTQDI